MLFAGRGKIGLRPRIIHEANCVRRGAGLVEVVGLAVHDAEVRLEHGALQDARVLGLGRLHRVGLHQRGDVGHDVRRRVATVPADLVVPQVGHLELVVRRDLGHELARVVLEIVVVQGLRSVGIARVDQLVHHPLAVGAVHPHAILHQAAAARQVEVVGLDGRIAEEVRVDLLGAGPVLGLQIIVRERVAGVAAPLVAAGLGHHVDRHAAGHHFGRNRRGHIVDLLEHALVVVHHRGAAAAPRPVHRGAVDVVADVVGVRAVRRHAALLHRLRAAHVIRGHLHAGNQLGQRPRVAPGRHTLEDLLAHDRLLHVRPHVDGRRGAGDRNRLLEAAHFQPGIDGRHKRRIDADARLGDGLEPLQFKRHAVVARRQAIESVGT